METASRRPANGSGDLHSAGTTLSEVIENIIDTSPPRQPRQKNKRYLDIRTNYSTPRTSNLDVRHLSSVEDDSEFFDSDHKLLALQNALEDDAIYLTSENEPRLSKKRSFLLMDVLDEVEGRPGKRQELSCPQVTVTPRKTDSSLSIHAYSGGRKLKRQMSDFDVLYASAKSRKLDREEKTPLQTGVVRPVDKHAESELAALAGPIEEWPSRGRQLRPKRSMIAMSLERAKAISPSRHRLDELDTNKITSFDALLEIPVGFKAEPCSPALVREAAPLKSHDVSGSKVDFEMDATSSSAQCGAKERERRALASFTRNNRLRHVKSAKDILQKYSTSSSHPPPPLSRSNLKLTGEEKDACGDMGQSPKRVTREMTLRNSLRGLLGLRRKE